MELYKYLKLDDMHCEVALIKNAVSDKLEKKDILKVNEVIDLNFDLLGYIAPQITVNVITDGVITKKIHPKLPETISGVLKCKNPRCITSIEQELEHVFKLTDPAKRRLPLHLLRYEGLSVAKFCHALKCDPLRWARI